MHVSDVSPQRVPSIQIIFLVINLWETFMFLLLHLRAFALWIVWVQLFGKIVNELLWVLRWIPSLHVKQSVKDSLSSTEPFRVISSEGDNHHVQEVEDVPFVLVENLRIYLLSNLRLVNDHFLVSKKCLFEKNEIRSLVLRKLQRVLKKYILLPQQNFDLVWPNHSQELDSSSLLFLVLLSLLRELVRCHLLSLLSQGLVGVSIVPPKWVVDFLFEDILLNALFHQLLYAGDVS